MEECDQEEWSVFDKFGVMTSCLAIDHLEVDGPTSLIAVTKVSLRGKNTLSNAKTEECDQKYWSVCKNFDMILYCSATYFLKVCARFSSNVATKASFRDKRSLKV